MDSNLINEKCKCCACEAPLSYSRHINWVNLNQKADWKFPVWKNMNTGQSQLASAFICDRCYDAGEKGRSIDIKFVVEFKDNDAVYHPTLKNTANA
jgi:hypothetical protein